MSSDNPSHSSLADETGRAIKVLLIDDSAVIRGLLTKMLNTDPDIEVIGSAHNGEIGVKLAGDIEPDVVILDIEMPVMDGLTALPKILEASPNSKVIMFSSLTEKGASVSMKALSLGAVECLVKPNSSQGVGPGSEFERKIFSLIKSLVPKEQWRERKEIEKPASSAPAVSGSSYTLYNDSHSYKGRPDILLIGSSTGGPQALFAVLKQIKEPKIPIAITQHMPATFTKILAQHIEHQTGIPAYEGEEGMKVENGKVYVAPGGFHMVLVNKDNGIYIHLDDGPPENFCKPAVDPMFRSALKIYDRKMLAVILTGMGNDGMPSSKDLVNAGCRLVAQDEASSVVWGMPGAVARANICSAVLPLQDIGPWVQDALEGKHG